MTDLKRNVPELRFPEFESEWEEKKLGELCTFSNGINAKKEQYGHGRKFINVLDILNKNYITYNEIIGKVAVSKEVEHRNKVEYGDLLFLRSSETREEVGTSNVYLDNTFALYGGFVIRGKKVANYDPMFIKNLLNTSKIRNMISASSGGSTRYNVNQEILKKLKLKFTGINEQQKIGEFFSKLDRQIELEEEKLALLVEQKKGYMQKIFSQELRFKDDNGEEYPEWEEHKLGEVYKVTMGQSPKSINYTDDHSYPVLVQGNADLYKGNIYPRIYTKETTKLVKDGDILLTVRAPVGEVGIAQFEACIGRGVCSIEGDKFIYYHLEYFNLQSKWQKLSQGSTFESISGSEVRNVEVSIPSASEREKISRYFTKIDQLIKRHSQKIDLLKQRKKGFLQKMFV
ncbi:restriction endonuclease subunit S [Staphylococcus delphini]|uniref:Restriction endonuclease subunit S n=1 Tax=Staphylococcus delphini TaxID=53344 RepID=A0AAX0QRQ6_9STAP|nr:restriction endonuclease subunit S [Staphylococcus delphini]PCF48249.1 restriction endonuclease subunit S [Staphylococcus delphini]PNZ94354.1 restriction endonuclease subunit S [Staphylococcus delphini]RIZ48580.1 restriction endonuclease subunit S [Staphylococcus delphini]VED63412.1 type I restriction-modification system, S subunit [Staphylococcus delphini]